ncbi:MAG: YetF domain-containing protein [Acidimicrobiia bacterium]
MDFGRMLFGDFSWSLTFEIVIRTVVMYIYTLAIVRFIGKRGLGHLSPFELVIIVALGSAVGDPMLYADVALLHGFVVITVVVVLQRLLVKLTERSRPAEIILESKPRRLVAAGEVDSEALEKEELTEAELFTALRESGIENLGQVKLAYLEPSGTITVFKFDDTKVRPGRSVLPEDGG